jgi:hypothetical protein
MSKRSERKRAAALYRSIAESIPAVSAGVEASEIRGAGSDHADLPIADSILAQSKTLACVLDPSDRALPRMKKFRFQLLHQWLTDHVAPCRVADVGGGKGLLAYLLRRSGWDATVIDPVPQTLPSKYKDLTADRQIRIAATERVPQCVQAFAPEMAGEFDLLIAMHAHGCNIQLIDAAAHHDRRAILLPCCIIDEPLTPPPGVHWLECVVAHAVSRGFRVEPFRLNFKGQNIGLYLH